MKKIKRFTAIFALVLLLTLTGCRSKPLPEGMDADSLVAAGREVVLLLVDGEYEAVYELLREDQRAVVTVASIRDAVLAQTTGAGEYKQIDDYTTTGTTIKGTQYGVAIFYCDFSEEDVLVRVYFDSQMQLVGLDLRQD